jgi:FMN-dependent NADH-azoreductase
MANVLFIKGHPGTPSTSISLQMAEEFVQSYQTNNPGDTVTVIDLYQDYIPLIDAEVMSAWGKFQSGRASEVTASEGAKLARMNELSDQFVAADKAIFAAPMWNFGYPPMLKAYMDAAMVVAGKTFAYTAEGPKGLLEGTNKKAVILEASGSHFSGTPVAAHTHASNHLKGILQFIGFDSVEVVVAEGVSHIVAAATAQAKSVASAF